ncbi:MAG TPA: ATP-binding cassette domain-containing protein [Dehalococcoidia bacterium]|nr:ATP-binding cassette domain-containing protein [Dehalococcoidia bacterium]
MRSWEEVANMLAVEVSHIVKSFADKVVVNDLSFSVAQGEIFGLIGPNGAGKTTTIRMMMDIIKPDSGDVTILGEKLNEATKNRLGYLPEERGLYKKLKVLDSIVYLASLKSVDRHSATEKANELLTQIGMLASKNKKIEALSRGMGQIIQFIVTIIHDPQLLVLDEPFAGLDPVNTELLKGMLADLKNQGKAVILSTHQMNQVEELCDRILMINNGQNVLYGDLSEIKARYRGNSVLLDVVGELGEIPGVTDKRTHKGYTELMLDGKTTPQQVLAHLISRGMVINRFEIATPSLNEIFLKEVGKKS